MAERKLTEEVKLTDEEKLALRLAVGKLVAIAIGQEKQGDDADNPVPRIMELKVGDMARAGLAELSFFEVFALAGWVMSNDDEVKRLGREQHGARQTEST